MNTMMQEELNVMTQCENKDEGVGEKLCVVDPGTSRLPRLRCRDVNDVDSVFDEGLDGIQKKSDALCELDDRHHV